MARNSIPYPVSPESYPSELIKPPEGSSLHVAAVLAGLFLFLLVYVGLIAACFTVIIVMMTSLATLSYPLLWIFGSIIAMVFALVLIKGLFNHTMPDPSMMVEITPQDQPVFFGFMEKLIDEIGIQTPDRVYLSPDVNAAMMIDATLLNLFKAPRKNLLIGLGLVNVLNLSEFKAVMAHEFGHFSQKTSGMLAYVMIAKRIMANLIVGEGLLDRTIFQARMIAEHQNNISSLFAWGYVIGVGGPVFLVRQTMKGIFYVLTLADLSLSRKSEFHADRVAVSVSGSNAIVHALSRLEFAEESLQHAVDELEVASQHKLYTSDLFRHQSSSAGYLRKLKKKPDLGQPPDLDRPEDGRKTQVFNQEEPESEHVPEMWSSHPKNFDREENAKKIFITAQTDERSPWLLFTNRDELKEELTYRFYKNVFRTRKIRTLAPASEVLAFIEDERAEVSYDPKYAGAYDQRPLFLDDIASLKIMVMNEPWDNERIERVHSRLYRDLKTQIREFENAREDYYDLMKSCYGRPRGRDKRKRDQLEKKQNELKDWFASFDRRVFLVHQHMAKILEAKHTTELARRYDFHLQLQKIHRKIAEAQDSVTWILDGLHSFGNSQIPQDFFEDMMDIFRDARKAMKRSLQEGDEMKMPEMANVRDGTLLSNLIFEGKLLREPSDHTIEGEWISKLIEQLGLMRHRVNRMDFKSLGAILLLQDRIANAWLEKTFPQALVLDDEIIDLEPIPEASEKNYPPEESR